MVKIKILQVIILILLINTVFVTASIDSSYKCKEKNCMEGTEIDFSVNIFNNINKSINVGDVYIKDRDYGTVLAFDLSENIFLGPNEVHRFNFTGLIKAPTKGYTFYYVPCFRMSYVSNPEEVFEICGKTVKSFTVIPLSEIECKEDSECGDDEYCNTFSIYKCKKLECEPDETVVNHSCAVLEPEKIVIINWMNVIFTAGFIVLAVVILFLFIGRKQKHEEEDYVDMTAEFSEDEESPKKDETDKKKEENKEEKLDKEYKKIEESSKELKEDKLKKDEENEEIEDAHKPIEPEQGKPKKDEEKDYKKESGGDEEIKKKKSKPRKKGKNNKKKYKRVKQNKVYEVVPDYADKQEEEVKKTQDQEIEDSNIDIIDYSGYEDDDEENRDIF